jgi:hypothetical protein
MTGTGPVMEPPASTSVLGFDGGSGTGCGGGVDRGGGEGFGGGLGEGFREGGGRTRAWSGCVSSAARRLALADEHIIPRLQGAPRLQLVRELVGQLAPQDALYRLFDVILDPDKLDGSISSSSVPHDASTALQALSRPLLQSVPVPLIRSVADSILFRTL